VPHSSALIPLEDIMRQNERENNKNTRQYKSILMTLNLQKTSSHKRPRQKKKEAFYRLSQQRELK